MMIADTYEAEYFGGEEKICVLEIYQEQRGLFRHTKQ